MPSTSGRAVAAASAAGGAPLQTVVAKLVVDVHPSKAGALLDGVRDYLNAMLLRWSDDFDGAVLAYRNERITNQQGTVCYWYPLIRVEVAAELVLFRPQPGNILVGTVNKVGSDYLGLLLLGVFNASVGRQAIRKDLRCTPEGDCWVSSSNADHQICEGSAVRFVVTGVEQEGFLTISGSMREPWTGDVEVVGPAPLLGPGALTHPPSAAAGNGAATTQPNRSSEKNKKRKEGRGRGSSADAGMAAKKKRKKGEMQQEQQQAGGAASKKGEKQQQQQQPGGAASGSPAAKKTKKEKKSKQKHQAAAV